MLFISLGTLRASSTEDTEREILKRFADWKPAQGVEQKALYVRADGRGPVGLYEASSAAALYESLLPFTTFIDFDLVPLVDVGEAVTVMRRLRGLG